MKLLRMSLSLVLAGGLAACSQLGPVSRDRLAANIAPILKVEQRFHQMRSFVGMLGSRGGISEAVLKEMQEHYDIYYVYYSASSVYLARGDVQSYLAHIRMAEGELAAMEALLKHSLAKDGGSFSSTDSGLARSEL